jgi:hypothetical protein
MVANVSSASVWGANMTGSREFAGVKVPGLHLRSGEFVVRHDRATLKRFVQARVGGGFGTRRLRFRKSIPKEELREASTGDLVLTNRRLLFLGAQTLTIPFEKILRCEHVDSGLVVSEASREHPHVLVLKNADLWCFLIDARVSDSNIRQ